MAAQALTSPSHVRLDSARGRWVLAATVLGSGMVFLDGTVVNVALPRIQSDLVAPVSGLQWILDAYALFLAALLLVGGALGDFYGRKPAFIAGLSLFTVASAACGLAPTLYVLIVARAVQGIGGALLVPGSLAIIKAVIDQEDSARAIGLWTGLSSAITAIGPLLGGYLAASVTWRAIFYINVPIAAIAILIAARFIPPNKDPEASGALDWIGAALAVVGLGGLTFGLIQGPSFGWRSTTIVASLLVGVLALLLFPLQERRALSPMVPLRLFRSRNFTGSNLATLAVYFCFSGSILFLTLDLQQVQGYTPLEAGAALLPIILLLLLLSPRMGALMNRVGARLPMTVGSLLIALAFFLLMLTGRRLCYPLNLLPAIIIQGTGMAIFITPLTATVMGSVPARSVGAASGINNAVSRVAALLAIALLGVVVVNRFDAALSAQLKRTNLPPSVRSALIAHRDRLADDPIPASLGKAQHDTALAAVRDAFVDAFHWAMGVCVVLSLLSAAISATVIRDAVRSP